MRKGGLLDGFPVHLFSGSGGASATLILDSPDLGRVQVTPPPECQGTAIAVSADKDCLEHSRASASGLEHTVHLVQADPRCLPFRDGTIEVIVALSPNISTAIPPPSAEVSRVLAENGQLVEVSRTRELAVAGLACWSAESRAYYVRPASGANYFVTRDWLPSPWPFRSVDHGKVRTMRIYAGLLVSRFGSAMPLAR